MTATEMHRHIQATRKWSGSWKSQSLLPAYSSLSGSSLSSEWRLQRHTNGTTSHQKDNQHFGIRSKCSRINFRRVSRLFRESKCLPLVRRADGNVHVIRCSTRDRSRCAAIMNCDSKNVDEFEKDSHDSFRYIEVGGILDAHSLQGEVKILPFTDYKSERFARGNELYLTKNTKMLRNRHKEEDTSISASQESHIESYIIPERSLTVSSSRSSISGGREVLLVKFAGFNSRDDALALRGKTLVVKIMTPTRILSEDFNHGVRDQSATGSDDQEGSQIRRPSYPESELGSSTADEDHEFYAPHLEDMAVVLQNTQQELGRIVDIYGGTGTYDTLKIIVHCHVMRELILASTSDSDLFDSFSTNDTEFANGVLYVPFAKDFVPVVDIRTRRCEITPPNGLLELAVSNFASRLKKKKKKKRRANGTAGKL